MLHIDFTYAAAPVIMIFFIGNYKHIDNLNLIDILHTDPNNIYMLFESNLHCCIFYIGCCHNALFIDVFSLFFSFLLC